MSAPQTFVLGPPSSIVVDRPCPLCGLSSPILVIDPPIRRAHTCRCGALVGTPGCFVDDRGARLPMRAVFSPAAPAPCATCHRAQQRVLIDDRPGSWCAMCGLVALPERRSSSIARATRSPPWHRVLLGCATADVRAAAAVAVVLVLVVAALHLHTA